MYLVFIWFMPCSLIKKLPHSSCFLPHVEVAPGIVVSALLMSGYHADTPITIKAEAIRKADSRSH